MAARGKPKDGNTERFPYVLGAGGHIYGPHPCASTTDAKYRARELWLDDPSVPEEDKQYIKSLPFEYVKDLFWGLRLPSAHLISDEAILEETTYIHKIRQTQKARLFGSDVLSSVS